MGKSAFDEAVSSLLVLVPFASGSEYVTAEWIRSLWNAFLAKNVIGAESGEKWITEMTNEFFVPELSRWSYLTQNAKQADIALKIDTALNTIEKQNPTLKGALPDNYYSRLGIDGSKLAALLDEINNIQTNADKENDIMGRVYEYFLTKFALQEGKRLGRGT